MLVVGLYSKQLNLSLIHSIYQYITIDHALILTFHEVHIGR